MDSKLELAFRGFNATKVSVRTRQSKHACRPTRPSCSASGREGAGAALSCKSRANGKGGKGSCRRTPCWAEKLHDWWLDYLKIRGYFAAESVILDTHGPSAPRKSHMTKKKRRTAPGLVADRSREVPGTPHKRPATVSLGKRGAINSIWRGMGAWVCSTRGPMHLRHS
jgi:hypothetical protein